MGTSPSLLFHIDDVHFPELIFHPDAQLSYGNTNYLKFSFALLVISFPSVFHQGPKCPSGCRIEGLMNKYDHGLLKRIEKIRSLLDENTVKQRSTDSATKQTYDYLKDKLTTDAGKLSSTLN